MVRFIKKFSLGFLFICLLGLGSCSDNDVKDPENHNPSLVGKWKGEISEDYYKSQETFEFKSNGEFIDDLTEWEGNKKYTTYVKGNWTSTDTKITLTIEDVKINYPEDETDAVIGSVSTFSYKIDGKCLYIDGNKIPLVKQ